MKRLALICACAALLCLGGCVLPHDDPAVVNRSERWYRRTDPAAFFAREQGRGRVYFVGIYDPVRGKESPVPGVSSLDPAYRVSKTWFVNLAPYDKPAQNERFLASATAFARRYNPLVLAYLHQHPTAK